MTGFTDWGVQTDKVCEVSWSDMHQALLDCPWRFLLPAHIANFCQIWLTAICFFSRFCQLFRYIIQISQMFLTPWSLCMSVRSNPSFISYTQRVPCPCSSVFSNRTNRFVDLRRVCWRMSTAIGAARGLTCRVAGNGLMFYVTVVILSRSMLAISSSCYIQLRDIGFASRPRTPWKVQWCTSQFRMSTSQLCNPPVQ